MSLLKLDPATERLRRIARAHAAGELSRAEYRRIRRDVVNAFSAEPTPAASEAGAEDVTEDTRRRVELGPLPPPALAARPMLFPARRRWRWLTGLGAGLLLMLTMWMFAPLVRAADTDATASQIPPVAARDPNPLTSPRLDVDRVILQPLDWPALGLDGDALQDFIDERLRAMQLAGMPGTHGFTAAELSQIGELLDSLDLHAPDARLTTQGAEELKALIDAQKARRGLSVVELERLAAELTRHLRTQALPIAVAYVPVQAVSGGVVELAVLPGELSAAHVRTVGGFPAELAREALAPQMDQVVRHEPVAAVVYQLNEMPGVSARARFAPGSRTGGTELDLQVGYERRWDTAVRMDNHGNRELGHGRVMADLSWYNLAGRADVLAVGLLTRANPGGSGGGYLDYQLPLGNIRHSAGVHLALDRFTWSDGANDVEGDVALIRLASNHRLLRSRQRSHELEAAFAVYDLQLHVEPADFGLQDQQFWVGSLNWQHDRILDGAALGAGLSLRSTLGLDIGRLSDGRGIDSGGNLIRATARLDAWRLLDSSWLPGTQKLRLRSDAQLANDALPGPLQTSLGGAGASAGYRDPMLSADSAAGARVEWRWTPPGLASGALIVLADSRYGRQQRQFDRNPWLWLNSAGLGWQQHWQWPFGALTGEVLLASPLFERSSNDRGVARRPRLLLTLEFQP